MIKKHQRVSVSFDTGPNREGTIIGVPGESVEVYGNYETLPPDHYRVIYFANGYGYKATFHIDRIIPLA